LQAASPKEGVYLDIYELVVLFHPDLEIDIDKPLKKLETLIKEQGAKIVKQDNWGKRKLAYPIKKQDYAVYVYYEVEFPKQNVAKFDSLLNITDEIIRHLIVKHIEPPEDAVLKLDDVDDEKKED